MYHITRTGPATTPYLQTKKYRQNIYFNMSRAFDCVILSNYSNNKGFNIYIFVASPNKKYYTKFLKLHSISQWLYFIFVIFFLPLTVFLFGQCIPYIFFFIVFRNIFHIDGISSVTWVIIKILSQNDFIFIFLYKTENNFFYNLKCILFLNICHPSSSSHSVPGEITSLLAPPSSDHHYYHLNAAYRLRTCLQQWIRKWKNNLVSEWLRRTQIRNRFRFLREGVVCKVFYKRSSQ